MPPGELLAGAEPFSAAGGPDGALVLHGFTGTPQSVRGLARALAGAGLAVEAPLLPGHGTTALDMAATGWQHWTGAAEAALGELAGRCRRTVVLGLSMGGTLACWLATRHPVAALVAVNPWVEPPGPGFVDVLRTSLAQGVDMAPAVAQDLADPAASEVAYDRVPVASLISLAEGLAALAPRLAEVTCPTLVVTSRADHVVPPASSDFLAAGVGGPVERMWLDRSFHVATLDHDAADVERRAVAFCLAALGT